MTGVCVCVCVCVPFLLESLLMLGLTAGCSSVSVDMVRLRGTSARRFAPLGVRGSGSRGQRRVCVWRRQVCVRPHRLMGEGGALALTQHPTHTHVELER